MGAYSTTTTLASAIITKHKKPLLETARGRAVALKFAVTEHEGIGADGTVRYNRLLRLPKITAARTNEYDMFAAASARDMTTNYIEFSPSPYEDAVGFTDMSEMRAWIDKKSKRDEVANQIARSIDYFLIKKISGSTGFLRHRIDGDGTYEVNGTVDSGSTTSIVDTELTQADDFWDDGVITFTNPEAPLHDVTTETTNFVNSTDTLTMTAVNHAPTSSTRYHLVRDYTLAATDKLTTAGLIASASILRQTEASPWPGGTYRSFIAADQEADLWGDSTFINSAIYDSSGRLANYRLGRWMDIEFLIASELYREDVDLTENQATGVVHCTPIFGANSYCCTYWGNSGGKYGAEIFITDKTDSANLTASRNWLSWKVALSGGVLRATGGVNLLTGATALPVL